MTKDQRLWRLRTALQKIIDHPPGFDYPFDTTWAQDIAKLALEEDNAETRSRRNQSGSTVAPIGPAR